MTENPTIFPPSGLSQPSSLANSTTTPEDAEDPSGEINCICEVSDDDGSTVCCDGCDVWQHIVCVGHTVENLPAKYYCQKCLPRSLDISKAKDHQRKRREQAKRSHKKKRPAAASHKKKEPTNGSNGTTPRKVSSTTGKAAVPGFGKLLGLKEIQQPPSRKRGHRASQSTNTAGPYLSSQPAAASPTTFLDDNNNASPISPSTSFVTRNGDIDYGKSTENYRLEYTDISCGSDQYAGPGIQTFIGNLASSPLEILASHEEPLIHYSRETFASYDRPKTSVRKMSDFPNLYPRWSLVLETPVSPGQLVTVYRGEVALTHSRRNEFRNQLDMLRHPNLYVLFHPNLPIYIDARKCGSEARFVRRSCQPNLEVRTIVIDKSEVCFGLFAKDTIKVETQLTLCWDLCEASETFELAQEGFDWNLVRTKTLNELAGGTARLTKKIGDCQCLGENECPLAKIKNGVSALKPSSTNGTRKRCPIKRNPSIEPPMPVASKEPSPERLLNDDDEDDNRSVSAPSSRSKPRSRDLTPSTVPDTAVEIGEMTGREARKFKEVLSRIEKQQQEEQLPQSTKRRKRNSTVSLPTGTFPLPSPGTESKDWMKVVGGGGGKQKFPVHQRSPYSPPATTPGSISIPGEYSVTDAGVGRRESNSPAHSEPGKQRRRVSSDSPVEHRDNGEDLMRHRSKIIMKPPRPQYKNASVQTDDVEDGTPWWQQDHTMSPPRPPRLPLRKRLMQSLQRDREEAVIISIEDRKRKHDDTASHSPEGPPAPKSVKLSSPESAPVKSTPAATDIKQSEETESIALRWAAANNVKSATQHSATQASTIYVSDPNITKPSPPSIYPSGPALADIFADSDLSASHQGQGAAVPLKSPSELSQGSISHDQPHVNGFRSSGLHVQLPPGPSFPNAPTTPSLQGVSIPSTTHIQSPLSIISSLANPSSSVFNNSLVQPSPTRKKKLSLQDYGKRKQKVEAGDKVEDKPGMKPIGEEAAVSLNPLKTPPSPTLDEQQKNFDSSSTSMSITPLPPPETPSQGMTLNSSRVPTEPKEYREGSSWSVR